MLMKLSGDGRSRVLGSLVLVSILLSSFLPGVFGVPPSVGAETRHILFEFSETVALGEDPRELAVAFHSLSFVDENADVLREITFGTPEANSLQLEGWFDNEEWSGVGSFQWAGGPDKEAIIRVEVPDDAKGLLLNVNSITEGMRMNVTIGKYLIASNTVEPHWHLEYVPIDVLTPLPREKPVWIDERYFPSFPSSDRIYVIHVDTALADWWGAPSTLSWRIGDSQDTMMGLTLVGMQGVINRYGSRVYLDWEEDDVFWDSRGFSRSRYWLEVLKQHVEVVELGLDATSAVNFLLDRYGQYFKGAVIYDPGVPDTINLATMYAGLENRVILAPEQLELTGMPGFTSVRDLRDLVAEQGWDASEEGKYRLYEWVYENLWPDLENRIIGLISPGPPTSGTIGDDPSSYHPLGLASRDYIVALNLTALWISPSDEPQASLFERFLEESPSPIPVFGNYGNDEVGTVALASEHGDWDAAIAMPNTPLSPCDLTVFSGVRPEPIRCSPELDVDRIFSTLGERPVMTMWNSDGDNLQYQIDRGFHGGVSWVWDELQGQRFGWETNPTLIDLAPSIWNHYVESRDEVSMISCLSGSGYTYPQLMTEQQLREYVERTADYLSRTGLRVIHVSDRYGPFDEVAEQYSEGLHNTGYLGAFVGLSGWPWGLGFSYHDGPIPAASPSFVLTSTNGDAIIENLLGRNSREVFVDLAGPHHWYWNGQTQDSYIWHWGDVVEDGDALGGRALLFSTENPFISMNAGPFASMAPGEYEVTYRLKVADNTEGGSIAQLYIGYWGEDDWINITSSYISPSDFSTANDYQNFTLPFTLDEFTEKVELRIDYYGGASGGGWASTDMHANYIIARRESDLKLPVFAALFISLMTIEPLTRTPELAEDFEAAGGIALHPDEFMAVLNPEFMIEWATPILGQYHPELDIARDQLGSGDFFTSLLTVREALRHLPWRTYRLELREEGQTHAVNVHANTWITPLEYEAATHTIVFDTHGPPDGTVSTNVSIPNDLTDGPMAVSVDGLPYTFGSTRNDTHTSINLQYSQGPHTVEVTLPHNEPPVAGFTYTPAEPRTIDLVEFNDASEDVDGSIVSWTWDFGDGYTSSLQNPSHRFTAPGTSYVTLTVTDDGGAEDSVVMTVQITPLSPPEFHLSDLIIEPRAVRKGDPVTISVTCVNIGEQPGSHTVSLKIDGEATDATTVNLDGGEARAVGFEVSDASVGIHSVEVDGLAGSFRVRREIPGFSSSSILLGVIIGIIVLWWSKDRYQHP